MMASQRRQASASDNAGGGVVGIARLLEYAWRVFILQQPVHANADVGVPFQRRDAREFLAPFRGVVPGIDAVHANLTTFGLEFLDQWRDFGKIVGTGAPLGMRRIHLLAGPATERDEKVGRREAALDQRHRLLGHRTAIPLSLLFQARMQVVGQILDDESAHGRVICGWLLRQCITFELKKEAFCYRTGPRNIAVSEPSR